MEFYHYYKTVTEILESEIFCTVDQCPSDAIFELTNAELREEGESAHFKVVVYHCVNGRIYSIYSRDSTLCTRKVSNREEVAYLKEYINGV